MSTYQKEWLSKWLPLVFSILANAAIAGYVFGKTESRIGVLEARADETSRERLVSYLVTRNEYAQRIQALDTESARNREDHTIIMQKLDRLIELRIK